jgi:P4 family phage/plasmid primase-like protien
MDSLFGRYYIPDFKEKLDQNPFILGFTNGVYDFKQKCFRVGIEEDYISLSTGYDYEENYDNNRMDTIRKIILQICCEREDLYKILLTTIAHALIGDNCTNAQLFYCWYGRGSNGKSTITNLLKNTLGSYYTTMPTTFLTQKTQRADGCNSEIAKMVGRRFVVCSETEENTPINISTLKNFTGEETIGYRGLYESIRETNITWSLWLLTNDKVKIPSDDYGTLRRFKYMPFNAKFVENTTNCKDNDNIKHYKKDKGAISSMSTFRNEFFNLLLPFVDEPLDFPQWTEDITNEMIKSQDKLGSILSNLFEQTDDDRYGLSWLEIKSLMRKEKMFHQLNFNSDCHMFEKVSERLEYSNLSVSSYTKNYISTVEGCESDKKSKKYFTNIKRRIDDEEMEDSCYL